MKIPYFDAHCDTIYRCQETGGTDAALEMDADRETQTAYYAACVCLRENGGHIDLVRGRAFARYGQFFALYWDAKTRRRTECWPSAGGCMTVSCGK